MALQEVLKVIAEDKASGTVKKITDSLVRMEVIGSESAGKFSRKLENMFGDVIVGGAYKAGLAFAGLGAAGVAALGALTYKSLETQLAFDRMRESHGGATSEFLGASRDLTTSYDDLGRAISDLLIDGAGLPEYMSNVALSMDRITKALDSKKMSAFEKFGAIWRELPGNGLLASTAESLGNALGAAVYGEENGPGPAPSGKVTRLSTMLVKVRTPEQIQKDHEASLAKRIDAEIAAKEEQNEYLNMLDQARFNREMAAAKRLQEEKLKAFRAETEAEEIAFQRKIDIAKAEEEAKTEAARQSAEIDAYEKQRRQDAISSANDLIGALSDGIGTVKTFWSTMNDGSATAADKIRSILGMASSVITLVGNILMPGAGSAIGGGLGLIGQLFSTGGVVHAASGMRVPGVGAGDRVPAMLERGEVVIPAGASHPSFLQEVAMAAGGGGGRQNVTINQGYLVPPTQTQTKRMMSDAVIPALSELAQSNRASIQDPRIKGSSRGRRT